MAFSIEHGGTKTAQENCSGGEYISIHIRSEDCKLHILGKSDICGIEVIVPLPEGGHDGHSSESEDTPEIVTIDSDEQDQDDEDWRRHSIFQRFSPSVFRRSNMGDGL